MGMGKQNSRAFSFFKDSISSQFCITTFKSALFQLEASKCKGALHFFDSDTGDKHRTTAQIE